MSRHRVETVEVDIPGMRRRNLEQEQNLALTTSTVFLEAYNNSLPQGFPKATVVLLKKFQVSHPVLFKKGDEWAVDKHRKRLMDWLSSYRDES